MEVDGKKKDGGEKDWEDPRLLGSGAPSPSGDSSQCHQLLLSNQWDWLNIMNDAQNRTIKH